MDELLQYSQSIRIIEFNNNEWKESKCNCEEWKKLLKCNHVIAIAYILKKIEWPAIQLDIEGRRKPGRPKKIDTALKRSECTSLTQHFFPSLPSLPVEEEEEEMAPPTKQNKKRKRNERVSDVEISDRQLRKRF